MPLPYLGAAVVQWITHWTTKPGVARLTPATPVCRMRLETEVHSSYDLVVGGTLNPVQSLTPLPYHTTPQCHQSKASSTTPSLRATVVRWCLLLVSIIPEKRCFSEMKLPSVSQTACELSFYQRLRTLMESDASHSNSLEKTSSKNSNVQRCWIMDVRVGLCTHKMYMQLHDSFKRHIILSR